MSYIAFDFDTEMKAAIESSDKEKTYALPDGNIDLKEDYSTSKSPTRLHFKVTYKVERQASARDHGLQEHGQGKEEHFKNFNFLNFEEHFNFQHVLENPFRDPDVFDNLVKYVSSTMAFSKPLMLWSNKLW